MDGSCRKCAFFHWAIFHKDGALLQTSTKKGKLKESKMTPREKRFLRYILGKASNEHLAQAEKITGVTALEVEQALDLSPTLTDLGAAERASKPR